MSFAFFLIAFFFFLFFKTPAHVFTTDTEVSNQILNCTSSGSACVNDAMIWMSNHDLPFGGVGNSGVGAYHGKSSFDLFSHHKSVLKKSMLFDLAAPWRYPPYNRLNGIGMPLVAVLQHPWSAFQKKMVKYFVYLIMYWLANKWGIVGIVRDACIQLLGFL